MIFETLWDSAQKGELILVYGGMCHFHLRRDGQITIREIIVLPREQDKGIGRQMLYRIQNKHPEATSIFAKVPADLRANGWYETMGFEQEGEEETKSGRAINLWRLQL
jgi:ribosomal protein S18 acetylase RimI-like enzyme